MLKKLLKYAAVMFGANIVTAGLSFIVVAFGIATRPKEAFGEYELYRIITYWASGCFFYGFNAAIQTFAATDHKNRVRYAKIAYVGIVVLSVVLGVGGALVGTAWKWSVGLAIMAIPWSAVLWWSRYIARSTLHASHEASIMVVASLATSGCSFLFLSLTDFEYALIFGDISAIVIAGLAGLWWVRRSLKVSLKEILGVDLPKPFIKKTLSFTAPLWVAGHVGAAKGGIGSLTTAGVLGARSLASLGGAHFVGQFVSKPMEYISQAALPVFVGEEGDQRDLLFKQVLRLCLVSITLIGISVAIGCPFLFLGIDFVKELLTGEAGTTAVEYADVPLLMMLGSLALPPAMLEMVSNQYSVAQAKQRIVFYGQCLALLVIVIALGPLITRFGVFGVIATNVLGEYAQATLFIVYLYRLYPNVMRIAALWTVGCVIAVVAALVPAYLHRGDPHAWLWAFPSAGIFIVFTFIFQLVRFSDFSKLYAVIKARRDRKQGEDAPTEDSGDVADEGVSKDDEPET